MERWTTRTRSPAFEALSGETAMNDNQVSRRKALVGAGALGVMGLVGETVHAAALDKGANSVADFCLPHKGPPTFELRGKVKVFGRYTCFGEVVDLETGVALGVLTDEDGDRIVGDVMLAVGDPNKGHFHFRWRDSVRLSNCQTYVNTGKFAGQRPPGLVVIAIIAILIGLPLPAVQK
jgi:hypothetical protein